MNAPGLNNIKRGTWKDRIQKEPNTPEIRNLMWHIVLKNFARILPGSLLFFTHCFSCSGSNPYMTPRAGWAGDKCNYKHAVHHALTIAPWRDSATMTRNDHDGPYQNITWTCCTNCETVIPSVDWNVTNIVTNYVDYIVTKLKSRNIINYQLNSTEARRWRGECMLYACRSPRAKIDHRTWGESNYHGPRLLRNWLPSKTLAAHG